MEKADALQQNHWHGGPAILRPTWQWGYRGVATSTYPARQRGGESSPMRARSGSGLVNRTHACRGSKISLARWPHRFSDCTMTRVRRCCSEWTRYVIHDSRVDMMATPWWEDENLAIGSPTHSWAITTVLVAGSPALFYWFVPVEGQAKCGAVAKHKGFFPLVCQYNHRIIQSSHYPQSTTRFTWDSISNNRVSFFISWWFPGWSRGPCPIAMWKPTHFVNVGMKTERNSVIFVFLRKRKRILKNWK
jgi:hypothetical protein